MSLKWEGEKVKKKMESCIMQGINQTMSEAVIFSKTKRFRSGAADSPPISDKLTIRTATLEGSIRPVVAARKEGNEFIGVWGSVDVAYALVHELGGKNHPPRPFLRPAADAEYPKLAGRIRKCFEGKRI